jgi:hypothetical protein
VLLKTPFPDGAGGPPPTGDLLNQLRGGTLEGDLGSRVGGWLEFGPISVDGTFHMLSHELNTADIQLRSASNPSGVVSATPTSKIARLYPNPVWDGTEMHVFVYNATGGGRIERWTAPSPTGTYTFQEVSLLGAFDFGCAAAQVGGYWYAAYIAVGQTTASIARATSLSGPWTDLGDVFSVVGRPSLAVNTPDPECVVFDGRLYLVFATLNTPGELTRGRIAVCELNTSTGKAKSTSVVIADGLPAHAPLGWANPAWTEHNGDGGALYLSTQYGGAGVSTGWAKLARGNEPSDGRLALDLVRLNTTTGRDIAVNLNATTHGTGAFGSGFTAGAGGDGGAYGWLAANRIENFTLTVDFTPGSNLGSGYRTIWQMSGGSFVSGAGGNLWLPNTNTPQFTLTPNGGASMLTLNDTTAVAANTRTRISVRRSGSSVTLYRDGTEVASGTFGDAINNMLDWSLANHRTQWSGAGGQQFPGITVHEYRFIAEARPLSEM